MSGWIELRGVRVHNLKNVDVDIPRQQLIALCGVSGSGKTSLALDTLYAEGQRRYIESFSAASRQYLQRLPQPEADRMRGLPPAIAVSPRQAISTPHATVGSVTEIVDYLRLIYARHAQWKCPECGWPFVRHSSDSIAAALSSLPAGTRYMVTFPLEVDRPLGEIAESLRNDGFVRWIVAGSVLPLDRSGDTSTEVGESRTAWVVIDRLTVGKSLEERVCESLESALQRGQGSVVLFFPEETAVHSLLPTDDSQGVGTDGGIPRCELDGRMWQRLRFGNDQTCDCCGRPFPRIEPRLFQVTSPLGACPVCEGRGVIVKDDDVAVTCVTCGGVGLRSESLAATVSDARFHELCGKPVESLLPWFQQLGAEISAETQSLVGQVVRRLDYLRSVGLGYLSLDRNLGSLSTGETQRVLLTSTLSSSLVNMLYVLDEPSVGLHPWDVSRLVDAILKLKLRGNSVVMVEHEASLIQAADEVIELGPGAGEQGGEIVFQGSPAKLCVAGASLTGEYLEGRLGASIPLRRRPPNAGWLRLTGANGHNLKNVSVEFPLGVLCAVSGVSGAGKSSLVAKTLYPALQKKLGGNPSSPLAYDEVAGITQVNDVVLVDQSPVGRTSRSNPVTYIKAFDAIRKVFAETTEARIRKLTPGHFSFNVAGGRCDTCKGEGLLRIDMQFLADVVMVCHDCQGKRFKPTVLEILYRGRSIADVLEMSVRQAIDFFRGQGNIQQRLEPLSNVGLAYLILGQSSQSLSAGEAQRIKLAAHLAVAKRGQTLFLIDEPTAGLHFADVLRLLDVFSALVDAGHSVIVVEHDMQVLLHADYIIDLGPGPADAGGSVVAQGTPEEVARSSASRTGRVLAKALAVASRPTDNDETET